MSISFWHCIHYFLDTYDPLTINAPRFLLEAAVGYRISEVVKRSGVYNQCKREVHPSHGMKKFFMTQCERSGRKSTNVKMLLGHDIGVSGHYYRPAESDILEVIRLMRQQMHLR